MHRFGVVGISYRHASAGDVARFGIAKADVAARLPELRAALGGADVIYLGTCNRVEVLFACAEAPATDRRREVFRALLGREPVAGEATSTLRTWTGEAAVEHLLLVACGLDSAQAGEQEIYVQLRAAWQTARAAQATGALLDRIVSEALSMARHAHRLGYDDAPSLADLATERVLAELDGPAALVALAGVSPMTRRCGMRLRERGVALLVVNRTLETAQELAHELGARAMALDAFRQRPPRCAALVCASGASEPILDFPALELLAPHRPLIVDFGLPPNVDPDMARRAGLERIGIDELTRSARDGRVAHLLRLAPVRAAIDERLARLRSELAARAIGPQLAELRGAFERIAAAEVERLLKGELADLDAVRRERLAGWATMLAHRLAHLPLSGMRAAAEHASAEATAAFFREARLTRSNPSDTEPPPS
jgi:glutamyl-tRNA reductase